MSAVSWELRLLKALLWTYIVLCLVIASLNWGYLPSATAKVAKAITGLWHFYENWFKSVLIVVCGWLTLRIIHKKKQRTTMRKGNLIGFCLAALLVHIILPLLLKNPELYYFAMPLPWSTVPLQAGVEGTAMHSSLTGSIALSGIRSSLLFFWIYSATILVGTVLFGRRVQCSTLCLFNGFASEVFAPAFPLVGAFKTPLLPGRLALVAVIRKLFFVMALALTLYWTLFKTGGGHPSIAKLETVKYLIFELLMAMFFWVAFVGRLYCYYCPLGTLLGWLGRVGGQRIATNQTHCIQCGKCTAACPLSIDVRSYAMHGLPMEDLSCVGCGHCIDACPTETLKYRTRFIYFLYEARRNH
ncbi:MAG: 4Fe-4S binding protein [Sphaerochaeta sp.]|nr:4Fe-4S binding protein [Sphaerochaeta sp.]